VDAGKARHLCVVIDGDGRRLLSRRVANDEPESASPLAYCPRTHPSVDDVIGELDRVPQIGR